jgi:hypothetical protein
VRLLRSWPAVVPPGRAYVQDTIERLILRDYDYAPLAEVDDDVLLVEWDIAVDGHDLALFAAHARQTADRVLVAPYRLYVTTVRSVPLRAPVWCHRRTDGSHVDTGEPFCSYFGFGLIYLPRTVVTAFRAEWSGHFSDGSFGGWHRRRVTDQVPIDWDVRPAHLHYDPGPLVGVDDLPVIPPPPRRALMSDLPTDEPVRQAWLRDPARQAEIAALLRERAGLLAQGKADRVPAVDEQLAIRGHIAAQFEPPQEPPTTASEEQVRSSPPKGRRARPRQTAE